MPESYLVDQFPPRPSEHRQDSILGIPHSEYRLLFQLIVLEKELKVSFSINYLKNFPSPGGRGWRGGGNETLLSPPPSASPVEEEGSEELFFAVFGDFRFEPLLYGGRIGHEILELIHIIGFDLEHPTFVVTVLVDQFGSFL